MVYSPLHSISLLDWQIKYCVTGGGPDVLLIHGWASSSRMWQRLMNDLSKEYRCVAVDLPGFGESDKPGEAWYSIDNYVSIVARLIEALGLQAPAIIGHSMGGTIALAAAGAPQPQVSRVVAINPIVTGRTRWDLRLFAESPLSLPMVKLGHWFWPIASGDWAGPWLGRERSAHYRRQRNEWHQSTAVSLTATLRAVGRTNLSAVLPDIAMPTLVLLGRHDLTAPNDEGRLAARTIAGAELVELPSGHLPTDDMPVETFEAIDSFLAREYAGARSPTGN